MNAYRLSESADLDFERIFEYGLDNYGKNAAVKYQNDLTRHFQDIANFPLHHQAVEHIRKGYRRSVHGVHTVYYYQDKTEVVIVRILGRQDPFAALQ